jgi:hypothetical protein
MDQENLLSEYDIPIDCDRGLQLSLNDLIHEGTLSVKGNILRQDDFEKEFINILLQLIELPLNSRSQYLILTASG